MPAKVNVPALLRKKKRGEKIAVATCYDYPSALLLDEAGLDAILIGDSVGDNVLGYENTIPVTLEEMVHHSRAVCRGIRNALTIADLPFMSYQITPEDALRSAGRLLKETGVESVKLEGGEAVAPTIARLVAAGIPVMGHVGLTPQSVRVFGGFRVQGRAEEDAERLVRDAKAIAEAGAFGMVLELMPAALAERITAAVPVPTIGIGAGAGCDGQVQVFHDLFGLYPGRTLKHNRRYAECGSMIREAAARYVSDVREGVFPAEENSF